MQDIIKNMHSKRFLLIYLAVVAILLLFYLSQQGDADVTAKPIPATAGAYQLQEPQRLPNFLLRDNQQNILTNADLQGRWHFMYFYDASCAPQCQAIWQVLANLADRYAGHQLGFWIIDATPQQQLLPDPPRLPANVQIIYDPSGDKSLWQFFTNAHGDDFLWASLLLVDPAGAWQAGFKAPFTSDALQQFYLQLRKDYARGN